MAAKPPGLTSSFQVGKGTKAEVKRIVYSYSNVACFAKTKVLLGVSIRVLGHKTPSCHEQGVRWYPAVALVFVQGGNKSPELWPMVVSGRCVPASRGSEHPPLAPAALLRLSG
jgi:hypothetical protein